MKTLKLGMLVLSLTMVSTAAYAQQRPGINGADPNLSRHSKITCPHRDGSNRFSATKIATNDTVRHDKRVQKRKSHQ